MNIEKVIDNLWDLNKHGLQFKFEMEFEYGTLALDNTKMSRMGEKHGLAAAVFKDYMEVAKLPNPLSKLSQIDAFNWLQTQKQVLRVWERRLWRAQGPPGLLSIPPA